MSVLIVGAGAAGGYLGAQLLAAGRDVTFLVRPATFARLSAQGLRFRNAAGTQTTPVTAVTAEHLRDRYDVVVVAVRADAVESAIDDMRGAVGPQTRIVPIMNGMRHMELLTAAFGPDRALGAATRLVASQLPDHTINVIVPGIQMEIGQRDGAGLDALEHTAAELGVPNIDVTIRDDILAAMWEKFAFIASTAVLTCLVGEEIGPIAGARGGIELARGVLAEVAEVAAADGYPLAETARGAVDTVLTDPSSSFGPSMYRDMAAGRPIESTVLSDLTDRARGHRIGTPLADASIVRIDVHNRRLQAARRG
jgi:2-dehydropantoate 2-reductase